MGRPSMHAAKFLVAFAFGLAATLAQAAGFRFIEVPADADGPVLNGAIWYPCSEPPDTIVLGLIPYPWQRIARSEATSCRLSSFRTAEAAPFSAFTMWPRRSPTRVSSLPPSIILAIQAPT